MQVFELGELTISLYEPGAEEYQKVNYPIRYGLFHQILFREHLFQFNLKGQVRYLQGLGRGWPHPAEWLKRTVGNDWVYYYTGGFAGVYDLMGEHYLPCFQYRSNTVFIEEPFQAKAIQDALDLFPFLLEVIETRLEREKDVPFEVQQILSQIAQNNDSALERNAKRLVDTLEGRISILPPDCRHVDYDVIPIILAEGCLHNCDFCLVKNCREFQVRSPENITQQLASVKKYFGQDLANYNSVLLGQTDALASGQDMLLHTANEAYRALDLENGHLTGANLFFFGSVDSLLGSEEELFKELNKLPYRTYINFGLESVDGETLEMIKKPLVPEMVEEGFTRLIEINDRYKNLNLSANFLLDPSMPIGHIPALADLLEDCRKKKTDKGGVYISPMHGAGRRREIIETVLNLKELAKLPVHLFLMQRL